MCHLLRQRPLQQQGTHSLQRRGLLRQQRQVAHGGPPVRAVPGRFQLREVLQD